MAVGVQVMAWSGEEMYAFGNQRGIPASQSGGVYDPTSDRWRPLPPIPEEFALSGSVGDFVAGEFIVLGENWDPHLVDDAPLIAGIAFSPETNTWRTITPVRTLLDALARPPETHYTTRMAAVRHGDELAVFLPAGYSSDTPTIAFYNPATDTWRYEENAPVNAAAPTLISADTFVAYLSPSGTVLLHDGRNRKPWVSVRRFRVLRPTERDENPCESRNDVADGGVVHPWAEVRFGLLYRLLLGCTRWNPSS